MTLIVSACCGDFGEQKHTVKGVVVEVGACAGESSVDFMCSVAVETGGGKEYWSVAGLVTKGQSVYKHCWIEDDHRICFRNSLTYIRKGYRIK